LNINGENSGTKNDSNKTIRVRNDGKVKLIHDRIFLRGETFERGSTVVVRRDLRFEGSSVVVAMARRSELRCVVPVVALMVREDRGVSVQRAVDLGQTSELVACDREICVEGESFGFQSVHRRTGVVLGEEGDIVGGCLFGDVSRERVDGTSSF